MRAVYDDAMWPGERLRDEWNSYARSQEISGQTPGASHTMSFDAQGNKTYDSWEEAAKIRAQLQKEWEAEQAVK